MNVPVIRGHLLNIVTLKVAQIFVELQLFL